MDGLPTTAAGEYAHEQLRVDVERLDSAAERALLEFRTWTVAEHVVVVGLGVDVESEVEAAYCRAARIEVVRRPSGGRSVVIGPGSLQYSFVLANACDTELDSIAGAKRLCNRLLSRALLHQRPELALTSDSSGDLCVGDRKVGGLALKRRRNATLLHGTLLIDADLETIERALKHPLREPAYRDGRRHGDFLANLGSVDRHELDRSVRSLLARL